MSCLLLSGKVDVVPSKLNKLYDRNIRLSQTRSSLFEIIKTCLFDKIVVSDASNVEILSEKEIVDLRVNNNIIVEQIIFDNINIVDKNGGIKSINELNNIKKTLDLSNILKQEKIFYKITPRYQISNLQSIITSSQSISHLFYDYHFWPFSKYKRIIKTNFFKTDIDFFNEINIEAAYNHLDENNDYHLEHYFYEILSTQKKEYIKIEFPFIKTISGTSGLPVTNRFYYARNKISTKGYLAFSF